MNKITSNIIKGVLGRFKASKKVDNGLRLSWFQTKVIKHQEDQLLKQYKSKDFVIFYKRPYEFLHTYDDIFVREIYKFQSPERQPVIFDCGANIGISTLYFKRLFPTAIIEAFEPDASNFEVLSRNCSVNQLQNVTLHNAAVWTSNGTISFDASESEASRISNNANQDSVSVTAIRLADALQKYEHIHFLKMDIEGAEWNLLQDIESELQRVVNFFLEYHGKSNETNKLHDLMGILKSSGFSVYIRNAADNLEFPFVEKTTGTLYDVQLNMFCYRNP